MKKFVEHTLEQLYKLSQKHFPSYKKNNVTVVFHLKLKNMEIGTLTLKDQEWIFTYSKDAQNQNNIMPIFEFPQKNNEYKSKTLWPFFVKRIPSINNPDVSDLIKEKNIDPKDDAQMLANFGRRISDNHFLLEPEKIS